MGSDNFEQDLGELSGQLKALMPTLERMEARLHQAQIDAAGAEARNQATRKEFDDVKTKISNRLADIYKRIDSGARESDHLKNQNGNVKRDIKDAVTKVAEPLLNRISVIEDKFTALEEKRKNVWLKVWDIAKILIAAGIGGVITHYLK